ncbi:MAG: PBP1A family penicillin-binding protein [SAR86 cluster bacterium]|uniref:Penicillin-binding protein 1A n=1 Tax=SAR86 cluster bacterium TaxID=2030880 RepID=A0A520MVJ7_9GAMM|nr:MAG: PBP1A family penicillin-binding protein [SAR86 cluster bacterium]
MQTLARISFFSGIFICILGILTILGTYLALKPSLPEIKYVDESELQMPLRVYTKDGVLIGEFGEIKRRSITFDKIPKDIKNAFLAAEDDNFFNHQGISYTGLIRSFIRCLQSSGCQGGGGTITMQVVRGYLLTREQTVIRKIKEIYLALELESNIGKQEIFELYVNKIFLGNRSYGIEAAANTYFDKGLADLDVSESATIAALAQLPSKVNPVKNPRRTELRRNWILSRMLLLGYINQDEYENAISQEIKIAKNINLYAVDAQHLAELVRQEVIDRYGLRAYKEGWSVYTTIDSSSQNIANQSMLDEMYIYDKRHGWREPDNYEDMFNNQEAESLKNQELDIILNDTYFGDDYLDENNIANKVSSLFDLYPYVRTHLKALVLRVSDNEIILLDENFEFKTVQWSNEYSWARKKISIDQLDIRPQGFNDIVSFGDFVYLKVNNDFYSLDQIPEAEASLISINPDSGEIIAYIGGKNFNESNFDRIRLSFPQSGSSFKPFIYSSAFANGYNLSSLINDAPIVFVDENLESAWRPQNYTGEFYGPLSLREALTKSVNIVSIKLLRELGIDKAHEYIEKFGYDQSRLPKDLSLALGSGNFSPAEMVRGYSVIANDGFISDMHFVDTIQDRFGDIIFSHNDYNLQKNNNELNAFPWLDTVEMNIKRPYNILKPLNKKERVIDARISYLMKDVLKGFMKNGVAGRKSKFLNREDIGGKTGTTNDSVSTWFSGFHDDLVTTVWVGTDDFSSLGKDEFGSTIALPIWLNYMDYKLRTLEISKEAIPEDISFVRVNKSTGEIDNDSKDDFYFELFLEENVN